MNDHAPPLGSPCPFCEHWDLPIGCPSMDASGNLLTEQECPSLCMEPSTHTLVTAVGTVMVCESHFKVALLSL